VAPPPGNMHGDAHYTGLPPLRTRARCPTRTCIPVRFTGTVTILPHPRSITCSVGTRRTHLGANRPRLTVLEPIHSCVRHFLIRLTTLGIPPAVLHKMSTGPKAFEPASKDPPLWTLATFTECNDCHAARVHNVRKRLLAAFRPAGMCASTAPFLCQQLRGSRSDASAASGYYAPCPTLAHAAHLRFFCFRLSARFAKSIDRGSAQCRGIGYGPGASGSSEITISRGSRS